MGGELASQGFKDLHEGDALCQTRICYKFSGGIMSVSLSLLLFVISGHRQSPKLNWHIASGIPTPLEDSVPMPRNTVLRKGTIVHISGHLLTNSQTPQDDSATVYFRVGSGMVAKGSFKGAWSLDWDTSTVTVQSFRFSVAIVSERSPTLTEIGVCNVTLLDSDPIALTIVRNPDGTAAAQYQTAGGFTVDNPKLVVDGELKDASFDAQNKASVPASAFTSPNSKVSVQLTGSLMKDSQKLGVVSSPVVTTPGTQQIKLIPSDVKATTADDPFSAYIELPFASSEPVDPESLRLYAGGTPVKLGAKSEGKLAFLPLSLPDYDNIEIWITATSTSGHKLASVKTSLSASGVAPVRAKLIATVVKERARLAPWKNRFRDLIESEVYPEDRKELVLLRLPTSNGSGLSLHFNQIIKIYVPGAVNSEEYKAEIGERFLQYWGGGAEPGKAPKPPTPYELKLPTELRWQELYAILGPYHKGLFDRLISKYQEIMSLAEQAEEIRLQAIAGVEFNGATIPPSGRYAMVEKFMNALNLLEKARYEAAQILYHLDEDFGMKTKRYVMNCYVMSPTSPEDTGGSNGQYIRRDKTLTDYEWWRLPPPPFNKS